MTTTIASLEAIFSANTTDLMSGLRKADNAISGFGNSLQSVGSQITGLGASLGAAVTPAVAGFTAATAAGLKFGEAMTNANSILQLSEGQIDAISDEILAMGVNSIAGPQALAESFYEITSGVADASTHMDILATSVAVSEAGASSLQGTTAALVGAMNAYGFSAEEAAFAGDVLTRSVALGVFSMDELAAALPNVTGLAAQNGIAFDELAAATALISTSGFSAAQATTFLSGVMTAIVKPNEKMIAALDELGYSAADASALLAEHGLAGAMELINSTSAVAEDGLAAVLGTTEALNGATALLDENATDFINNFSGGTIGLAKAAKDLQDLWKSDWMADDSDGIRLNVATFNALTDELEYATEATESYTESARRIQRASPAAQFKLMKAQVAGLAIEVGTALMPAMVELFDSIKPVLTSIIDWVRENPQLVATVATLTFGIAAVSAVLIPLGLAISAVGTVLTVFGAIIGVILSPVGLLVVALGLLAYAYHENFLGIQDALKPAMEWLKGAFADAVGWIGDLVNAFQSGGLAGAAAFIGAQITELANSILNADWGAVWANIQAMGVQLWEQFKLGLVVAGDFILTHLITPLADQAWTFISSGGLHDAVYNIGLFVWNALLDGWKAQVNAATWIYDNLIAPLAVQAEQYITGGQLWEDIKTMGTQLWEGLKQGVYAYAGYTTFIYDNLVVPLVQSVVDSDWSGVVNNAVAKAETVITGIKDALVGGAAGIWSAFTGAMNDLIPNTINFGTTIDLGRFGSTNIGASFNLPDNPFRSGTPWTGGMGRSTPAGIVHGKEAVIPTGGMSARVVPSPGGLMVQTSGGRGGGISIQTVNVYGVQNVAGFLDELEKEKNRRSNRVGMW